MRPVVQGAEPLDETHKNASFDEPTQGNVPAGWGRYAGGGKPQILTLVTPPFADGQALLLDDGDPGEEIGVFQEIKTTGGIAYQASVDVAAVEGAPEPVNAFLQLRFLPSNKYAQRSLHTRVRGTFETLPLTGMMPEGDHTLRLYLYTHRGTRTKIMLDNVKLTGGVPPPPKPVTAPPLKAPEEKTLKDLHLMTTLVTGGKASAAIVVPESRRYAEDGRRIQVAVARVTGVTIPVLTDADPTAALPLQGHVIVLGNRSTNRLINGLYDAYYTLLDLKYPGVGGAVVRSLHDPYGNGLNAILVGGSDDAGVSRATGLLTERIAAKPPGDTLALGWVMDIRLGDGVQVPTDLTALETWEASDGYGSVGYFGWNSLSKRMAMYYMTGDAFHAKEFLRLAFPDKQALEEISDIDGERIENKDEPLAGAYHYNQHMMVLYWDLIEESPVFTDEQRLRITNSLARQLEHDDYARKGTYSLTGPASAVGSRHGQWAAISLYCLGRYFNTHYPDPVWEHCQRAAVFAFQSLHEHAWIHGESDNLFWYNTGIAPIFSYLCLSGDRVPVENGVIAGLLRGQEMLLDGSTGDRNIGSASLGYLHKAAYITGDGRWIHYRQRTRMDTGIFRLGQSFWPDAALKPKEPEDLCGTWSVHRLPMPMWIQRSSGLPFEQSFLFGSYRTHTGPNGDYVLLDGFNGASRNPYHTFCILDLRIAGTTLLNGYHNQVLTKADGMVEPAVAMDAALRYCDRIGGTATACAEVPAAAFSNWRRTLIQRLGRYAVVVDDLTFRTDSRNMGVNTVWGTQSGTWFQKAGHGVIKGSGGMAVPPGWIAVDALESECRSEPETPSMIGRLDSIGIVLLRAQEPGASLDMPFTLERPFRGDVFLDTVRYVDRGVVRILLDGRELKDRFSMHATDAVRERVALGAHDLAAGRHLLRLEVVDRDGGSTKCYAAVAGLALKPDGATGAETADEMVYKLSTCDPVDASGRGTITMRWTGPVKRDGHGIFFHLLAPDSRSRTGSNSLRVAPNAAVLRLPETALACAGTYQSTQAEMAVLASTHLYAREATTVGLGDGILSADRPLSVDWDFLRGDLVLDTAQPATVTLAGITVDDLRLDGRPVSTVPFSIPQGRHALTGARLTDAALSALQGALGELEGVAQQAWENAAASRQAGSATPDVPVLPVTPLTTVSHSVTDVVTVPGPDGTDLLAVAEDRKTHVMTADGRTTRVLSADGAVRVLQWWPEADALLVACADEKLIAFGRNGERKWVFTSVMDPAVFRAAKTYWFKTAPGHEGIHGLATGAFVDGKPQCILGSACTAEIINTDGSLAKRLPVFWGPGKLMKIVETPNGSHDALIARWPNGTDRISIVNSKSLSVRHGFYGVPSGHTMVGGWSAQNRVDLIWQDVNGDGEPELVSATNGRWNRVSVFARDGAPLHNAQFGPGQGNTFRAYLRDLKTADPDGDGKHTIFTATHDKLVVALDHQCSRLWSTRLQSAPCRLQPCGRGNAMLLVGCDDGTLVLLSSEGAMTASAAVKGRPLHILPLADGRIAVATSRGEVVTVRVP